MRGAGYAIIAAVVLAPIVAQQNGYWLSGVLTVVAAALVTAVILLSSRSRNGNL